MSDYIKFGLRFKRRITFPKFTMDAGEVWDVRSDGGTGRAYLAAIYDGDDRFDFAGGQCLLEDVERVPAAESWCV